ncbi:MAG: endo-1,4-beta-xylanase [Bacteroidales bacterium]|nr:endo-1,4-beta-xylanase [Bacteroidales bacterium]
MRYALRILLILSMGFVFTTCVKDEISYCDDNESLYGNADFPIGVAISTELLLTDDRYRGITINQFNRISGETAWLYGRVHPYQDIYDWTDYDTLVKFAETYQKDIIGHSLVYHDYLPDWLSGFQGSEQEWEAILKDHIQTIVSRYKGKIDSWIVVNEAFNEDGTLRNSIWKKNIGASYISKAFLWAHQANPDAKLFYNDYNLALNRNKLEAVLQLLRSLKSNGVPVHGVGCQLHIYDQFPEVQEINDMALKIQKSDFLVYYSEMDISLNLYETHSSPTDAMLMRQKRKLEMIVRGYMNLEKRYRYGISFWNVSDADTWIRANFNRIDWPCMWDDQYKPKPMYCGIKEALTP